MSRFTDDVIDAALDIAEGSPLDLLRSQRAEVRARTQSSYAALFDAEPGGLAPTERFVAAFRVATFNQSPALAAHYRARLSGEPGGEALAAAIDAGAEGDAIRPRLATILRHVELLTFRPADASPADLAALAAQGLSEAEIVTLSQIVAFVAYQVRVAAGLALIAGTP
jgi:CMD domain protein